MRISSKVRPGCSKGDQGITKVKNKKTRKSDSLNDFYDSVERLQIACSDLLHEVILTEITKDFTVWLEEACHAFAGFYAVVTTKDIKSNESIKHLCLSKYTLQKVEQIVDDSLKEAESIEFQRFSNHPTLSKINRVRVESRSLERIFNRSIEEQLSEEKLSQDFSKDTGKDTVSINLIIHEFRSLFNRLSSLYWIFSQKELQTISQTSKAYRVYRRLINLVSKDCKDVKPLYWCSEMPELVL